MYTYTYTYTFIHIHIHTFVHRYGAATRSLRTGGAGMLYYSYRKAFEQL